MATKHFTRRPLKIGRKFFRGNQDIESLWSGIWRKERLLRTGDVRVLSTPAALEDLEATGEDETTAMLIFTLPEQDRVCPILYYQVSTDDGENWVNFDIDPDAPETLHVGELDWETSYAFLVRGVNKVGPGEDAATMLSAWAEEE